LSLEGRKRNKKGEKGLVRISTIDLH